MTGSDRLVVKVVAPSIARLDEIIRELSQYGTVTTAIVLSSRSGAVGSPSDARNSEPRKRRS